jgi:DNA helicase II / ATP-dependent DNA helicase PcrA
MFETATAWDDGLDEAQLEAATHGDGPLIVAAGAGTGKTRALTARLACLLDRGVPPQRILLLTFTRRAADEMLARASDLTGLRGSERPQGGTFHAVAHRHVAAYAEALDLPKSFGVLDPAGSCDLMDLLRGEHALTGASMRFPRSATLVDIYSRCINNERRLRDLVPAEYPWCEPHLHAIADLFRAFTIRKRRSALLDFDDLLLSWRALLASDDLGPELSRRFSFVLVDEYQDVNSLQVDIVRLLAPEGRGLTVVGDQAQAIYGFRGSAPTHLRGVVGSYPDATVIQLERNFRSRPSILDVANVIRPDDDDHIQLRSERSIGSRPTFRRCYDAPSEARAVVDQILDAHESGIPLRHQAVLVRAAHHSDLVEVELSVRKVPYRKYGGLRFLEAAHVKDFVAAARLLDNPGDEVAWFRFLRLHRNIGPSRARTLVDAAIAGEPPTLTDGLSRWPEIVAASPPATRSELSTSLGGLVDARGRTSPGGRAEAVLDILRPLVRARYADAPARLEDLERLVGGASAVDDLAAWLADLTLDPPASTSDRAGAPHLDEDYVVISTIHSAKGLEWPIVHLPHVIDGAIPSDMALKSPDGLDEEHRLLYVAVTRGRGELHLYAPLRMPHHRHGRDDRHSFAPVSRFIDERVLSLLESSRKRRPPFAWRAPRPARSPSISTRSGRDPPPRPRPAAPAPILKLLLDCRRGHLYT